MSYYEVSNTRRDYLYEMVGRLECIDFRGKYILSIRGVPFMMCIAAEPENPNLARFYLYEKTGMHMNEFPGHKLGRLYDYLQDLPSELSDFFMLNMEYF